MQSMPRDGMIDARPRRAAGGGATRAQPPAWRVVCDFDGTISLADTTDALLGRFADPAWRAVEERWLRGEIGSAECMRRQVAMIDARLADLDAWLGAVEIDPGFRAFAQLCARLSVPLEIASDGIDHVILTVLRAHGLGAIPVTANRMAGAGARRYALSPPAARCASGAGVCKCALVSTSRDPARPRRVLYVGDGRSDFCVSGKADLVAAKAGLLAHCRAQGYPHLAFGDFTDVAVILTRLHEGDFLPAASGKMAALA